MNSMKNISIAIVDDDNGDADATKTMIERYLADAHDKDDRYAITRFDNGPSFLDMCDDAEHKPYDIVFLDIEMPGIDGLETARILRSRGSRAVLVFTTKMAQYATRGYDVNAIGYLVKPIRYPGFALYMRKALGLVHARRGATIAIRSDDHMRFLDSNDVLYVEVVGHSLLYHTATDVWKDWGTLKAISERLAQYHFIPASRYCLVNLDKIQSVTGSALTLVGGSTIAVSRSKKKPLLEALSRYYRQ